MRHNLINNKEGHESICFVMTSCFALNAFVVPIINKLSNQGWDVNVLVNLKSGAISSEICQSVKVVNLNISRKIRLVNDLRTLYHLYAYLRKNKPLFVHTITPKAGFLGMLAARIAGVPNRFHTFTGQVWSSKSGALKWLLKSVDIVLANSATSILADSPSQLDLLISECIVPNNKIKVIGSGSICGIDFTKFSKDNLKRHEIRDRLKIPPDGIVYLFIGRLNHEKGVKELVVAYKSLWSNFPKVYLLIVGPDEGNLISAIERLSEEAIANVRVLGETQVPQDFYSAADIFCLPSHREGFGQVLIEAAACELPVIATKIYGIVDAVVDGETAILVPVGDPEKLASAMSILALDENLRKKMGLAGYIRVQKKFSQSDILRQWLDIYLDEM